MGRRTDVDRFPKVRSFIAEREFLEGKAREGSWSGPMTAEQAAIEKFSPEFDDFLS